MAVSVNERVSKWRRLHPNLAREQTRKAQARHRAKLRGINRLITASDDRTKLEKLTELEELLEIKLRAVKRRLFEQTILNSGMEIVIFWIEKGWLCTECRHEVFLVWNKHDFLNKETLKPPELRTKPVITVHRVVPCREHILSLEKHALIETKRFLDLEEQNFAATIQIAKETGAWAAPLYLAVSGDTDRSRY